MQVTVKAAKGGRSGIVHSDEAFRFAHPLDPCIIALNPRTDGVKEQVRIEPGVQVPRDLWKQPPFLMSTRMADFWLPEVLGPTPAAWSDEHFLVQESRHMRMR